MFRVQQEGRLLVWGFGGSMIRFLLVHATDGEIADHFVTVWKDGVSFFLANFIIMSIMLISHVCRSFSPLRRYIRSERSIILVNFCLSILASNLLILVGQSQTLSKVGCLLYLSVCVRANPPYPQLFMFQGSWKPLRNSLRGSSYWFIIQKNSRASLISPSPK